MSAKGTSEVRPGVIDVHPTPGELRPPGNGMPSVLHWNLALPWFPGAACGKGANSEVQLSELRRTHLNFRQTKNSEIAFSFQDFSKKGVAKKNRRGSAKTMV